MRYLPTVLLLAACTQTAAPVAMRGGESFRRDGSGFGALAPAAGKMPDHVYYNAPTTSAARVDSIQATDLAPPTSAPAPALTAPASATKSSLIWPAQGRVTSGFSRASNDGIVIEAEQGEPVYAAAGGEVAYVGNKVKSLGEMVVLKHENGRFTTYGHLGTVKVSTYQRVKQGDMLGTIGTSGEAKNPQLYFAVRDNKQPVDPEKLLPSNTASKAR